MKRAPSLKVRILVNLLSLVTIAWVIAIVVGYRVTEQTVNEQLDAQLKQFASSLSRTLVTHETTTRIIQTDENGEEKSERIEVQISHTDPNLFRDPGLPPGKWRTFSAQNSGSRILVGENRNIRQTLVNGMLWSSLWPMLVALPALAVLIWFSVTNGLRPLSTLANAIRRRTPTQLNKISIGGVPIEVRPVVESLNHLLKVVDDTIEREKQFTDHAAHELRTPLAGVKANLDLAMKTTDAGTQHESLLAMNEGIERASHLVSQLLTFSRLAPNDLRLNFSAIDLQSVAQTVVARLAPKAMSKNIDLGLLEGSSAVILGDKTYLEICLSNLVDNAIRYTPEGGAVDVRVHAKNTSASNESTSNFATCTIEDSGQGIPAQERARVFDRFVRLAGSDTAGSGIGLAIVKKIIELHHGEIALTDAEKHSGLKVIIEIPLRAASSYSKS